MKTLGGRKIETEKKHDPQCDVLNEDNESSANS